MKTRCDFIKQSSTASLLGTFLVQNTLLAEDESGIVWAYTKNEVAVTNYDFPSRLAAREYGFAIIRSLKQDGAEERYNQCGADEQPLKKEIANPQDVNPPEYEFIGEGAHAEENTDPQSEDYGKWRVTVNLLLRKKIKE